MTGVDRPARALALFEQALDLPHDELSSFIERECAGDPDLRAELEALLEADAAAPTFLDREPFGFGDAREEPPLNGECLGALRVIRPIGRGGMSTVYLAERIDGEFEQRVAIKVLHRDRSSEDMVERFAAERRILASLEHRAIVRILDSGITPDGRPYLAMDYVEGQRIDRWCDARRLTVVERLHMFRQVLDAVAYAHRALVVHRDLKPDNILVTADGEVRLLDFGISKPLDETGAAAALTRTGVRPMTPEYASPEQVRGERVTTACDIYALGVLLFELLVGRRPYDTAMSTQGSMERAILESEPDRPSRAVQRIDAVTDDRDPATTPEAIAAARRADPARLPGILNGDLDAIVLMALRKEPDARYRSADAMGEDIERYLESRPVQARRGSRSYHMRKFVRRHRAGVAIAVGALVVLGGSTGAIAASRLSAQQARLRAEREARTAREVTEFLVSVFGASDPFETPSDTVTANTLLRAARARIQNELDEEPVVRAELLLAMGRVYSNLGRFETADTLLGEALSTRQAAGEAPDTAIGRLHRALGANALASRDFSAAVRHYRRALDLHAGGGGSDSTRANVLGALADAHAFSQEPDSALFWIDEALAIDRSRGDSTSESHLARRTILAVALRQAGDIEGASRVYDDLLPRLRTALGDDHYTYATALNNAAYLHTRQGRWAEAVPLYGEALDRLRSTVGPEHPQSLMLLGNLASAQFEADDPEGAHASLAERLRFTRQAWPDGHWRVGSAEVGIGILLFRTGRYAEADTALREGIDTYRRTLGVDHPWTWVAETWVVLTMLKRGEPRATELLDRAAEQFAQATLGPDVIDDLGRIATILAEHGDNERAARFRAIAGAEAVGSS